MPLETVGTKKEIDNEIDLLLSQRERMCTCFCSALLLIAAVGGAAGSTNSNVSQRAAAAMLSA